MSDSGAPSVGAAPSSVSLDPVEESLSTPNCDRCLTRMEPAVTLGGAAHWGCPQCGQTRIA